jgi:hypothetical protein
MMQKAADRKFNGFLYFRLKPADIAETHLLSIA